MSRKIMQQALCALAESKPIDPQDNAAFVRSTKAIEALIKALAQPEQAPKLTDAGADTNIVRGLEPKGSGWVVLNQPIAMHVCNLWINPETFFYEVDRGTHPINEVIPVYTAPPKREWVGLTDEEIKKIVDLNTSDHGGFDIWCDGIAVARIVCAKLKELNK